MKNSKKLTLLGVMVLTVTVVLSGCAMLSSSFKDFNERWKGLPVTIQTYNHEGQVIDRVSGKSMMIERDDSFDQEDEEGKTIKQSKVLKITVGGKQMTHVGSSMVATEDGIVDYFDEFAKTADIDNYDRSIPVMNRMANDFKNKWKPGGKVILVRSQTGTPIATFYGEEVYPETSDIPSTSSFLVDGKRLVIYRSDYTVYDSDLFFN